MEFHRVDAARGQEDGVQVVIQVGSLIEAV